MEGTEKLLKVIKNLEKRVTNMEADIKHITKAVEITGNLTIENRDNIKRLQDTVFGNDVHSEQPLIFYAGMEHRHMGNDKLEYETFITQYEIPPGEQISLQRVYEAYCMGYDHKAML